MPHSVNLGPPHSTSSGSLTWRGSVRIYASKQLLVLFPRTEGQNHPVCAGSHVKAHGLHIHAQAEVVGLAVCSTVKVSVLKSQRDRRAWEWETTRKGHRESV